MAKINVRRVGYALGAEITGVDCTKPGDAETVAAVREALIDNVMLYFPRQDLTPEQFRAFTSSIGPLETWNIRTLNLLPGMPDVRVRANQPVVIEPGKIARKASTADRWHSDFSYAGEPPEITYLYAQAIPDVGGDTMFANMYLAFETLSPALQRILEPLECVRDYPIGAASFPKISPEEQAEVRRRNPPWVHPVVRTHPKSGRKALYLDAFARNFIGWTEEESKPLIDFLMAHATRYEFIYRHRWSKHDLVMWDNRYVVHYAVPDFDESQLRSLLSASVQGEHCGYELTQDAGRPLAASLN